MREKIYAQGFRNPWRFSFDSETGRICALDAGSLGNPRPREILDSDLNISSFGLDSAGEILILHFGGRIHRLEARG